MKRLLIPLILSIFLLSGCGIYNLSNFVLPDDAEFLTLVQELDTPEKIGNYMTSNFTYKYYAFYTPNPYILWQIKEGDCNDFSTFGIFIANYHRYTTYQLRLYYKYLKHRIAIYKENNYYSITNNQYYSSDFNSFEQIVKVDSISRNRVWLKYTVYDYDMNIIERRINL